MSMENSVKGTEFLGSSWQDSELYFIIHLNILKQKLMFYLLEIKE